MRYISPMILGYGIDRDPAQLRDLGAEKVWIDLKNSDRAERAALFGVAMRRGDTILILSRADLGHGREIPRFEALAAEKGVTIRVVETPKPARLPPGPAPTFRPDAEQERRIRHYWHGPFKPGEALRIATEEMGYPVGRAALNRHLGPRGKPKPPINTPAKEQ